jgi:hypothetical protein
MKKLIAAMCFMLAAAPLAMGQDKAKKEPSEKQKAQQERMKDCNAKAGDKGMKGDDRNKFMSSCLKGEEPGPSAKQKGQQDKMAACNKQAGDKGMKGDDRKKFMSACLKG